MRNPSLQRSERLEPRLQKGEQPQRARFTLGMMHSPKMNYYREVFGLYLECPHEKLSRTDGCGVGALDTAT
jgi:hypothetical protein